MKVVRCLFAVVSLFLASSLYAENNGVLGSTSKASATITLVIPANVFLSKTKDFNFNYDEPYQMAAFANGQYKIIKVCSGNSSCTPSRADSSSVIIFEPL